MFKKSSHSFEKLVVSVGGNALRLAEGMNIEQQRQAAEKAAKAIVGLYSQTSKMALVHGNGPQVGAISAKFEEALRNNDDNAHHPVPLDAIVADTQGAIGYMLIQAIDNELRSQGVESKKLISIVTRILVKADDSAIKDPSKPIGRWMNEDEANGEQAKNPNWIIKNLRPEETDGYRRVVASPMPIKNLESEVLDVLLEAGVLTIVGGGGGIPTVETEDGKLEGLEGVIDKDRTSALIAEELRADALLILTEAPGVMEDADFKKWKSGQRARVKNILTVAEAQELVREVERGSMQPKLEACIQFTENTGSPSMIGNFENAEDTLLGLAGTRVVSDDTSQLNLFLEKRVYPRLRAWRSKLKSFLS